MKTENRTPKTKYPCHCHPGRIAVVDRGGVLECWQCYLGTERFLLRFGPAFYPDFTPAQPPPGKSHLNIHLPESTWALMDKEKPYA